MLGVILNEAKSIKEFKRDYVLSNDVKLVDMINLLVKFYYLKENQDKDKIYKCIMEDISQNLKDNFVYTKWNTIVKRNINKFYKLVKIHNINVQLFNINKIIITNNELQSIKSLEDVVLEKLAFIMLVYAKISRIQIQSKDHWINKSISTICKEAKVGLRGNDQMIALNKLFNEKYIAVSKTNNKTTIKVCFFDESEEINENDLIITDFDGVIHQYLIWKDEKWIRCQVCGKWIKPKGNSRVKYCKVCAKNKRLERQRNYMKN